MVMLRTSAELTRSRWRYQVVGITGLRMSVVALEGTETRSRTGSGDRVVVVVATRAPAGSRSVSTVCGRRVQPSGVLSVADTDGTRWFLDQRPEFEIVNRPSGLGWCERAAGVSDGRGGLAVPL